MKIVTWNINSVRLRATLLTQLIEEQSPDVICLQETKTQDHFFPEVFFKEKGYKYLFYVGEKSYNGLAIISKIRLESCFSINLYNQDKRHMAVKIRDIELHNFYVPAGGDIPDPEENPKFKHKLEYINLMQNWFHENRTMEDKIILLGDLNIAPNEQDVWSSKQLKNVVSHTDIERHNLLELQNSFNFIDSCRYFIPMSEKFYTWWSYRNLDWQKSDRGRRLDHIWVSSNLQRRMSSIGLLNHARSWHRPSDHVPYILNIDT